MFIVALHRERHRLGSDANILLSQRTAAGLASSTSEYSFAVQSAFRGEADPRIAVHILGQRSVERANQIDLPCLAQHHRFDDHDRLDVDIHVEEADTAGDASGGFQYQHKHDAKSDD